jgi:hypothetical protein
MAELPTEAAIRITSGPMSEMVFVGDTHQAAVYIAVYEARRNGDEEAEDALIDRRYDAGFVTSSGRFVTRAEASRLAAAVGYQAPDPDDDGPAAGTWFTSEDDLPRLREHVRRAKKSFPGAYAIYR